MAIKAMSAIEEKKLPIDGRNVIKTGSGVARRDSRMYRRLLKSNLCLTIARIGLQKIADGNPPKKYHVKSVASFPKKLATPVCALL